MFKLNIQRREEKRREKIRGKEETMDLRTYPRETTTVVSYHHTVDIQHWDYLKSTRERKRETDAERETVSNITNIQTYI